MPGLEELSAAQDDLVDVPLLGRVADFVADAAAADFAAKLIGGGGEVGERDGGKEVVEPGVVEVHRAGPWRRSRASRHTA